MSAVGNCGKICSDYCYPGFEDDFCPGCPCNGYENEESEEEQPEDW